VSRGKSAATLKPLAVLAAMRSAGAERRTGPIVVDGAPALVPLLARELRAGGNPGAVREGGSPKGAQLLLWVGPADEGRLREASLARVPIVAVSDAEELPYVLATDIVGVRAGEGFPLDAIAAAVARRLGDAGPALAADLPSLRDAVAAELINGSARRNAFLAAGLFVPGLEMPALTLSQVRLVMSLARAHGLEAGRDRALEVLGVVGAGYGFRTIARQALDLVPVAGWAVKGAVAYSGTKALGEAAHRLFAERSVRSGS